MGARVRDVAKEKHEKEGNWKDKRSGVQSFVSFSLEKETKEPPSLLLIVSPNWLDQFGV